MSTNSNATSGGRRNTAGLLPTLAACLVAGLLTAAANAQPEARKPAGSESWVGKKVVVARPSVRASYWDAGSQMVLTRNDTPLIATVLATAHGNLEIEVPGGTAWHTPGNVLLLEESLHHFDRMIKNNKRDSWAYMVRAFVYAELGEWEYASRDAAEAVALNPQAAWLANQGVIWSLQGELGKAVECFELAVRKDSRNSFAFRGLGFARLRQNRPDEAARAFERATQIDSLDVEALGGLVRARAELCDFDGAVRSANFAVKHALLKADPLRHRAYAHTRAGDFEMALSDAAEAVKLAPKSAAAVTTRGRVYLAMWELDKAEADFDAALALDPKAADAIGGLGRVELARRRFEAAGQRFDAARKVDPGAAWHVCGRGVAHLRAGEPDEAVRAFEKASAMSPGDPVPHANLALCWLAQKMTNKAEDAVGKAVQLCLPVAGDEKATASGRPAVKAVTPNRVEEKPAVRSAFVLAVRARVRAARGEWEKATADAAEAATLDPWNEFALNTRAWLWATAAEEKFRNGTKAATLATALVERSKGLDPEHLETLAAAHAEAGEFDKAVAAQERAIAAYGLTPAAVAKWRERLGKGTESGGWAVDAITRLDLYGRKTPVRLP